jgi:hypothetical protein
MVGDRLGVAAEEIGVDVEGASHLRRDVEGQISLSVLKVEVAGEDGLAVLYDVDVSGAAGTGRENLELNTVAGLEHRVIGTEEDLVSARTCLEWNRGRCTVAVMIICFDVERFHVGVGSDVDDSNAAAVGGDLLVADARKMDREGGVGRCAVGIGAEDEDLIFDVRY